MKRFLSSILLGGFVAVSLVLLPSTLASTSTSVGPEIVLSEATLLSGGLDSCPTYNATACVGGLAAAVARRRVLTANGIKHVFLSAVDRTSVFVKLHPLDWGVNYKTLRRFNISLMFARVTFVTPLITVAFQDHTDRATMIDNVNFPPGHRLRSVTDTVHVDVETGIQVIMLRTVYRGLSTAAKVAADILDSTKEGDATNAVRFTVIMTHDADPETLLQAVLTSTTQRPAAVLNLFNAATTPQNINGTYVANLGVDQSNLFRIRLHTTDNTALTSVSVVKESLVLEPSLRDSAAHVADQQFLRAEAVSSSTNNPVAGATGAMPAPRTIAIPSVCIAGECAMGNFWADAVRARTSGDVTLFSGPWIQGTGWGAGNVTLLDLYGAYAFSNQLCSSTVLGLTLFELLNETISLSSFSTDGDPSVNVGDSYLPQVSGVRITYDKSRTAPFSVSGATSTRLVSIEVWNATTNSYTALERLRLYKVTGISYMCAAWTPFTGYLSGRYPGETAATADTETNLHSEAAAFIKSEEARTGGSGYQPGIFGRLVSATTSESMASWRHVAGQCAANEEFNAALKSCISCKAGFENAARSSSACTAVQPPTSNSLSPTTIVLIAVFSLFVLAVTAFALYKLYGLWQQKQRLRHCPKDASVPFVAFYVTITNEATLRELFPDRADEFLLSAKVLISKTAEAHGCYVARRLGAHFLLVTTVSTNALRCASALACQFATIDWSSEVALEGTKDGKGHVQSFCAGHTPLPLNASRARSLLSQSDTVSIRSDPMQGPNRSVTATTGVHPAPRQHGFHGSVTRESFLSSIGSSAPASPPAATDMVPDSSRRGRSVRSDTSRTAVVSVRPKLSVGIATGFGAIDYDEITSVYSYSGPVVDAAAVVTDTTKPGQMLATSDTVQDATRRVTGLAPLNGKNAPMADGLAQQSSSPVKHSLSFSNDRNLIGGISPLHSDAGEPSALEVAVDASCAAFKPISMSDPMACVTAKGKSKPTIGGNAKKATQAPVRSGPAPAPPPKKAMGAAPPTNATKKESSQEAEVQLMQVNPRTLILQQFDATDDSDDGAVAGTLTAALETAAGGLTTRRIIAVAVNVPALRTPAAFAQRSEHVDACATVARIVANTAGHHDVVSTSDGLLTVVLNAKKIVAVQASLAALSVAKAILNAVESETSLQAWAGIAGGPSVAGTVQDRTVVVGVAVHRAQHLALASAGDPCPVPKNSCGDASLTSIDELPLEPVPDALAPQSSFQCRSADPAEIVSEPQSAGPEAATVPPNPLSAPHEDSSDAALLPTLAVLSANTTRDSTVVAADGADHVVDHLSSVNRSDSGILVTRDPNLRAAHNGQATHNTLLNPQLAVHHGMPPKSPMQERLQAKLDEEFQGSRRANDAAFVIDNDLLLDAASPATPGKTEAEHGEVGDKKDGVPPPPTKLRVFVTDEQRRELDPYFEVPAADVLSWPAICCPGPAAAPEARSRKVNLAHIPDPNSTAHSSLTHNPNPNARKPPPPMKQPSMLGHGPDHRRQPHHDDRRKHIVVFAIGAEKVVEEDEWLYQLQNALDANPFAPLNECLARMVADPASFTRDPTAPAHPAPTAHPHGLPAVVLWTDEDDEAMRARCSRLCHGLRDSPCKVVTECHGLRALQAGLRAMCLACRSAKQRSEAEAKAVAAVESFAQSRTMARCYGFNAPTTNSV